MSTLTHTTTLTVLQCCVCGMPLALDKTWVGYAQRIGGYKQQFWCPYCGKQQGWGESQHEKEVKRLTEQRDLMAARARHEESQRKYAEAEAEHFRKSRDAMKGVVAKIKKRVGRGVCPCCSRHFANLQRHMATKHPEVAAGDTANETATA